MNRLFKSVYGLTWGLTCVLLLALSGVVTWMIPNPVRRMKTRIGISHGLAKFLCRRLQLNVWLKSPHWIAREGAALWVANHTSLLDAILIHAVRPVVFVTSKDMGEKPGLGFLARSSGCVFVERRNRAEVKNDSQKIAKVLKAGFCVVVFPEGTSTDGTHILPFKRGLFRSAIEAGAPIQPFHLYYSQLGGVKIESEELRKRVYVYGDHMILGHLFRIFTNPRLDAEVRFLEPIPANASVTPDELARRSRNAIVNAAESAAGARFKTHSPETESTRQILPA